MKIKFFYITFLLFITIKAQNKWSLEQCIAHAKEHNVNILRQQLLNKSADKDVIIAKGNYLPNANFSSSQGFSLGNSFDVSTGVGKLESRFNNFSLSSSATIFNGFANKYRLQQAKINAKKGLVDLEQIELDLSLDITNKYFQVLFNKEILVVAEEQKTISSQEVERLLKLYQSALKPKSELLQMEATLALDEKEVIIAHNNLNTSLIELKEQLDINDVKGFDINYIDINFLEQNITLLTSETVYNEALVNNPLLKSIQLDTDLNKKKLQIAKTAFYPSINFNYSFGSNYYHIQGRDDLVFNQDTGLFEDNGFFTQLNNNKTHYLGVSATIPIFNKFLTKSNIDKAKIGLDIANVELNNHKKELKNRIDIAYNNVLTSKATLEASQSALIFQKEVFKITQNKYKEGYITSYEFLENKSNYIKVNSEFIQAKYDFLFKIKVFEFF